MITFRAERDPDADLDYTIDWSVWLGDDTIESSSWSVPEGMAQHDASIDQSGTRTTVWLTGGKAGPSAAIVTNHIVTAAGRHENRSIAFSVQQR